MSSVEAIIALRERIDKVRAAAFATRDLGVRTVTLTQASRADHALQTIEGELLAAELELKLH
jgi:hypothetical protein